MLDEAQRRKSRGADVVVATADCLDREDVRALLEGLDMVGDGSRLGTGAVLARHPEVVCIDDLAAGSGTRLAGARQIAEAGITVVATVNLSSDGYSLDESALLAFADEIQLVDVSPAVLDEPTDHTPEQLTEMRERAFALVTEHADRLAATNSAERPVILACAPPEPGLEPLIRRAAALAAQLAGRFLVAVVEPPVLSADLKQVLAGYATLTEQLSGTFASLQGPPATALAEFARQQHVTQLLLPRSAGASGASRHHMLRELVSRAGDAEVHLLPAPRP
jgi:two-component system sensor histidine kinase KdpD